MASLKVGRLFAFGRDAVFSAHGACEGGMDPRCVDHFSEKDKLRDAVREYLAEGDVVLVKGSRGMRLDETAADIRGEWL
jgi:UDP-N-acetylmuramoyl-tripeptide--D-alanyl-D-alanine ligase